MICSAGIDLTSLVVSPAHCSTHGLGYLDIIDAPLVTNDIVNQVSLFGSAVHPCCLVFVCLPEKGVGHGQITFCTQAKEKYKQCLKHLF